MTTTEHGNLDNGKKQSMIYKIIDSHSRSGITHPEYLRRRLFKDLDGIVSKHWIIQMMKRDGIKLI